MRKVVNEILLCQSFVPYCEDNKKKQKLLKGSGTHISILPGKENGTEHTKKANGQ